MRDVSNAIAGRHLRWPEDGTPAHCFMPEAADTGVQTQALAELTAGWNEDEQAALCMFSPVHCQSEHCAECAFV